MINLIYQHLNLFCTLNPLGIFKIFFYLIISLINIINDIKNRSVFSILLVILTIADLIFWIFTNHRIFLICLFGCIGTLIIFFIIFFISGQGIGLGDMFYFIFFASLYGYLFSIIAFLLSFWIAALILIIPYALKYINKTTKIPLIPFLFTGCSLSILIGYILKIFIIK